MYVLLKYIIVYIYPNVCVKVHLKKTNLLLLYLPHTVFKLEAFYLAGYHYLYNFWCLTPHSAIFQLYHGDQF
jgi:hypothetical protein